MSKIKIAAITVCVIVSIGVVTVFATTVGNEGMNEGTEAVQNVTENNQADIEDEDTGMIDEMEMSSDDACTEGVYDDGWSRAEEICSDDGETSNVCIFTFIMFDGKFYVNTGETGSSEKLYKKNPVAYFRSLSEDEDFSGGTECYNVYGEDEIIAVHFPGILCEYRLLCDLTFEIDGVEYGPVFSYRNEEIGDEVVQVEVAGTNASVDAYELKNSEKYGYDGEFYYVDFSAAMKQMIGSEYSEWDLSGESQWIACPLSALSAIGE